MRLLFTALAFLIGVGLYGQDACNNQTSITYHDDTYDIVAIGEQCWFAENLNTAYDAEGEDIVRYWFNNDEALGQVYGGLYVWDDFVGQSFNSNSTPSGVQGFCPNGWHVPSISEWDTLIINLGGYEVAGGALKNATQDYWNSPNTGASNSSGFNALPSGYGNTSPYYFQLGHSARYWSTSIEADGGVETIVLFSDQEGVVNAGAGTNVKFSIRCLKDYILGCNDTSAINYDAEASYNDGSCLYSGCIDPEACNYNTLAIEDDGSCVFPLQYYNCDENCIVDSDFDGICDELEISGCTDSQAINYNPIATDSDDSCDYLGCMDLQAVNFSSMATVSDASLCLYDIDHVNNVYSDGVEDGYGDGFNDGVNSVECPPCDNDCAGDYTGDGIVSVADLLEFLILYGNICE